MLRILVGCCAASFFTGCADDLDLVGTVERRSIELAAPVSETLVEITVEEGQRVDAGQVIVRLDTEVASAELVAAEAARDAATAQLAEAEREFVRLEKLRQARVVAAQELDRARRARDEARATTAERAARVAQASKRLADLTIQSYAPGVVDQLPFEEGERVSAGGVVAVVVPDEAPWVRVWLPAREVARADTRAAAEVDVEGLDGTLAGVLEEVSREPEFTPHYALTERESAHLVYEARIRLTDAPDHLRPGLPARVRLSSTTDG
ncbi:MAG: efflux RND transporter periplasmic adaptor subunit [Acidobacteriota bacterium]